MNYLFLIVLTVFSFQSFSQAEFNDSNTYHILETYDPNANFADLEVLDPYFLKPRVIAMGEATHGTHEFSEMRHRLFKYLVLNHQFNTFYLEADYADCLRVNDYIHGAEDSIDYVINEIRLWPWITAEMRDLVEWMKSYNELNPDRQISFIGVDMQFYKSTLKSIDEILKRYGLPVTTDLSLLKLSRYEIAWTRKRKIKKKLKQLVEEKKQVNYSGFSDKDRREYSQLVHNLGQIVGTSENRLNLNYRDEMMAENLLRHFNSSEDIKGFYWAHNFHISKGSITFREQKDSHGHAGNYLDATLGDLYFNIGQEFYEGAFNIFLENGEKKKRNTSNGFDIGPLDLGPSQDSLFYSQYRTLGNIVFVRCDNMPDEKYILMNEIGAVLNKRKPPFNRAVYSSTNSYDAILFIRETSPTILLERKKK